MAAISAVFTISYLANLLGEDEDWLFELSIGMQPEDGSLWVYGAATTACRPSPETASTTCARSSPTSGPPERRHPRSRKSSLPCGPHRMLSDRQRNRKTMDQ